MEDDKSENNGGGEGVEEEHDENTVDGHGDGVAGHAEYYKREGDTNINGTWFGAGRRARRRRQAR